MAINIGEEESVTAQRIADAFLEMSQSPERTGLGDINQTKIGQALGFLDATMEANRLRVKDSSTDVLSDDDIKALIQQGLSNTDIRLMFGETHVSDRDIDRIRKLFLPSTENPFTKDLNDLREARRKEQQEAERARREQEAAEAEADGRVNAGNAQVDEALRQADEGDPEIQKLTDTIMKAAGGKPTDKSFSDERDSQKQMQKLTEMLLLKFLNDDGKGSTGPTSEGASPSTPTPSPATPTPAPEPAKKKPEVSPDDISDLTKSIKSLSENVIASG